MSAELDELARMARVEPPAELDAPVRERYRAVVLARRGDATQNMASSARARAPRARAAVSVPFAERCVYALGLLAYGVQASGFTAHWLWHALTSGR